jgi:signal peptidase II
MKSKFKSALFCLISIALISCDQVTKKLAKTHLADQQPSSYFHDFFRLEYVENTGAALSLGAGLPQPYNFILLSVIPLLLLLALFFYTLTNIKKFKLVLLLSFALIFAGGIGNIINRIFNDRHVTDFMNMGIENLRTGIFNVADICITAGVIGVFLFYKSFQTIQLKA